ncbi:MAG: YfiR family protein [Candidatus Acidiferrales bacterium]
MRTVQTICRFLLMSAITCGLAGGSLPGEAQSRANYRTEAEDLRHFAEFVEWSHSANGGNMGTSTTINFCILGRDPFGASLDESILGHPVGDRRPTLVRGKRFEDLGECDVLFVSSSEVKRQSKILDRVNGSSVLTVGETRDFAAGGGIIQFVPEGDRVSFLINVDAAGRAGLKIRAALLALAKVIHDGDR